MRIINFNIIECTQLKNNNKSFHTLLFKEQFKYLKTSHSYHLVDPSPWPLLAAFGGFMVTFSISFHNFK
jgi:hypothetical protein